MHPLQLPPELKPILTTGLYIDESLPIGWRIPATPQRKHSEALLLHAAIVLETVPHIEREDLKPQAPELARIEAKLDIALALLTYLTHTNSEPPEPIPCRLSQGGLLWPCGHTLTPTTELSLEVHLHDMIPVPLSLAAKVVRCQSLHSQHWVETEFSFRDPATPDLLERWIFLRHRKQIAARSAQE